MSFPEIGPAHAPEIEISKKFLDDFSRIYQQGLIKAAYKKFQNVIKTDNKIPTDFHQNIIKGHSRSSIVIHFRKFELIILIRTHIQARKRTLKGTKFFRKMTIFSFKLGILKAK